MRQRPSSRMPGLVLAMATLAAGMILSTANAAAITYTSGDVLYAAYRNSPAGAEYIVNLGSKSQFLTATSTFALTRVTASDLDAIVGATATNIFVGLFGVADPIAADSVITANGPKDDFSLLNSSMLGAVQQVDSFGDGLPTFSLPVPSGEPMAGKFTGPVTGSYQATLNGSSQGSLGGNLAYNVETRLSSSTGVRISPPKKIPVFVGTNNPISGTQSRIVIGFFTLSGNGTITYSPDFDGDLVEDENDLCPGFKSSINTDVDGDHVGDPCDCAPANTTAWRLPGAMGNPMFGPSTVTNDLQWTAPADPGGTSVVYDIFRANQGLFGPMPPYSCHIPDFAGTTTDVGSLPPAKSAHLYVIRAQNACGVGPSARPVPASCP